MTTPYVTVAHVMDQADELDALHREQEQAHTEAAEQYQNRRPASPVSGWDDDQTDQ
jgi:hypothetical protein